MHSDKGQNTNTKMDNSSKAEFNWYLILVMYLMLNRTEKIVEKFGIQVVTRFPEELGILSIN